MMKTNLQFFADPNPEPKPNDSNPNPDVTFWAWCDRRFLHQDENFFHCLL
ncbi:hypothetical protein GXP73_08865 [Leuconostoc lactis]|jgi:hypothetical protein|nr:hypothetical protein [Leuconostoc lactis]MBA5814204.1 hypothetical protein [Leuconostoc lactis]SUB60066.1 Uncharacterised protein [Pediococcus pentosaceus]